MNLRAMSFTIFMTFHTIPGGLLAKTIDGVKIGDYRDF